MKCPICGVENPEAARFCQTCGRPVASERQYRQSEVQKTAETAATPPSHGDERTKESELPLAATLVIVGVAVTALSMAAISLSENDDPVGRTLERNFLLSLGGNGFWMAVVGVGLMAYLSSRRRASPKSKSKTGELIPQQSFFHEIETSTLLGAAHGIQTQAAGGDPQVGGGVRTLLYLLSICVPAIGSVAGAALYVNAKPNYRRVGRKCMMISILSLIVISALGAFVYAAVNFAS